MRSTLAKVMISKVFQSITNHFPTGRIHSSKTARNVYRILFHLLPAQGRIATRTTEYRMWFRRGNRDLAYYIALKRPWEPFETNVLKSHLKPGMSVLDIGANIGHYTLVASRIVGAKGSVYSFEPVPVHFEDLNENLKLNGLSNVKTFNAALSDQDGELTIYEDANNPGGHSAALSNTEKRGTARKVKACKLDTFAEEFDGEFRPHLMKIDTQGSEYRIVMGGYKTIKKHRPIILFEFWPYGMKNCGCSAMELLGALGAIGYKFHTVDEHSKTVQERTEAEILQSLDENQYDDFTNILAVVV